MTHAMKFGPPGGEDRRLVVFLGGWNRADVKRRLPEWVFPKIYDSICGWDQLGCVLLTDPNLNSEQIKCPDHLCSNSCQIVIQLAIISLELGISAEWFSISTLSLPLGTFEERHQKSVQRVADDKPNIPFRKVCKLSAYQEIKSDMDWNSGRVLLHVGATRESHYPLVSSG